MKYIVSANYRDRSSPYRWLIRKSDEPAEEAKACQKVVATGIQFVETTYRTDLVAETGFGCGVVAECDSAQGFYFEEENLKAVETKQIASLYFDMDRFRKSSDDQAVNCAAELTLSPTGEMIAALA